MFVAVYWWGVHPGKEEDRVCKSWVRPTHLIGQRYGSYGARLHQETVGRFVGYAEWPDEETWSKAYDENMAYDEPETRAAFSDAVFETPPGNAPV